jgi:signal transduction histidine kinase
VSVLRTITRHGDLLLAGTLALVMVVEVWATDGVVHRPAMTLLALLATLPLALRCRHALLAFISIWIGLFGLSTVSNDFDNESVAFVLVFVLSLYSLGANTRGWRAWAAAAFVPVAITIFVTDDGDPFHYGDVVFGALLVGGPWLAGLAMRLRRQSERRLRREKEAAEAAIGEERARIARELHDVVAHAISVIVLQARGGRKQLSSAPDQTRDALDAIEVTASQALAEMRRLLGLLRESDDGVAHAPQPTLARLDELLTQVRDAGLPVELEIEGARRELPPGIDLSAYRIVQEALTNALKHAGPASARVSVRYADDGLELEVADDGAGDGNGDGTGHGLVGIRERVAVFGGQVDAGARPDGGYAVRARLPYARER